MIGAAGTIPTALVYISLHSAGSVSYICAIIFPMNWKTKAFIGFAKMVRPGWRANALFGFFSGALKAAGPRRGVAMKNAEIVFPDKTADERKRIVDESYESMIWTGLEVMSMQRDPSLVDKWAVEVVGREHVEEAFSRGKGVICVSAHIGNWEHSAAWIGRNCRAVGIVRHSDDPFQRELIETLRENLGLRTLDKHEPMLRAVSILKRNEMLGLLCDQHEDGFKAPFFGREAGTVQGPAVFAYLTHAPIIPIYGKRLEPFRFRIVIGPEIKLEKGPDRESTIADTTIKINRELEKMVLAAPGQWLWQHRRYREIE